jgi:hypothetical protein
MKTETFIVTDFPLMVICPDCCASVTAKCTQKKMDGFEFVQWFHFSRIQKAREMGYGDESVRTSS